jgi:hypothetical protein
VKRPPSLQYSAWAGRMPLLTGRPRPGRAGDEGRSASPSVKVRRRPPVVSGGAFVGETAGVLGLTRQLGCPRTGRRGCRRARRRWRRATKRRGWAAWPGGSAPGDDDRGDDEGEAAKNRVTIGWRDPGTSSDAISADRAPVRAGLGTQEYCAGPGGASGIPGGLQDGSPMRRLGMASSYDGDDRATRDPQASAKAFCICDGPGSGGRPPPPTGRGNRRSRVGRSAAHFGPSESSSSLVISEFVLRAAEALDVEFDAAMAEERTVMAVRISNGCRS